MTHEHFTIGVSVAYNALAYEVPPADVMVRLVEKYELSHKDAYLCVCAGMTLIRMEEKSDTLPPPKE